MNKKELRKQVLARRDALSEAERREKSVLIAEKVIRLDAFQKSNIVLLYNAIRNEAETMDIFQEAELLGKEIYLPRVMGDEMEFFLADEKTQYEISRFSICEPIPKSTAAYVPKESDEIFVLVPGAAFDADGNRIGYGGGYYDKYLRRLADGNMHGEIHVVAIAYDCQMVEVGEIKTESHDMKMDCVITEKK